MSHFSTIDEAIEDLRCGRMVVVLDPANRENQGDLTIAAEHATPEAINFMARYGGGLICLALTAERCYELGLYPMTARNQSRHGTDFTVTVEARHGVTTGISAGDRARTIAAAIDPTNGSEALTVPGHMFPLKARKQGVLERPGHTEAAVDLARLAGCKPAGVVCAVMNEDGSMAQGTKDLVPFCERHDIKLIRIEALIAYRRMHTREVVSPFWSLDLEGAVA